MIIAVVKLILLLSGSWTLHCSAFAMQASACIMHEEKTNIDQIIPPMNKEPPLDILLIVEPTPFGYVCGYANRFKEMLKHLHAAGDDVEIITPDPNPKPPSNFMGYTITTLVGFQFPLYKDITLSLDVGGDIRKVIQRFRPDVIHVSTPSAIAFPTIFWAKYFDIPLVMSYHTNFAEYSKTYLSFPGSQMIVNFLLRFHNFADLTLCTSPQLQDSLISIGIKNVDVWQKGINADIFAPSCQSDAMRERMSQGNSGAPLLLYVGRLGMEKKLHRLTKVLDANPGARLALVGQGPAEEYLRQVFTNYAVNFVGLLKGDELSQAFASADLFVMPSDTETLGFVVLESLASGVPVVAVAAGGLVDIVSHGLTGYLAENSEDMAAFTAYSSELIADKSKRAALGRAGREWALQWSWETATSKLRNIQYRKAIAVHKQQATRSNYYYYNEQ